MVTSVPVVMERIKQPKDRMSSICKSSSDFLVSYSKISTIPRQLMRKRSFGNNRPELPFIPEMYEEDEVALGPPSRVTKI
mmetsp:Transcript_951/g.1971  ORF Transcript_951/g.1971 Transcript_951/m.1971 type:complete len:80 (+) Transcript_951:1009-1248(+)